MVTLIQIERAAHVAKVATQRDASPIAEQLRHARAHLNLLAQAGIGPSAEPARDRAQGARQQHRCLVAAVVAQAQPEAATGALAQQHGQVARSRRYPTLWNSPVAYNRLMRWSSVPRDTQEPRRTPRARARNPSGTRPAGSNRTLVTSTDSGSTTGARGALARRDTRRRASAASIWGRAARPAASPRAISSRARVNPNVENPRTSGRITTSHLLRCSASESHTRNDTDCTRTSTSETIESRGSSGSVTSLQISTSAPRARASCAGRFRTTPPSITAVSASSTGAKTLGRAMLARMASGRNP